MYESAEIANSILLDPYSLPESRLIAAYEYLIALSEHYHAPIRRTTMAHYLKRCRQLCHTRNIIDRQLHMWEVLMLS